MKLSGISFANFKGANEIHELGALNVIVGPNGSGKTRILQALQLGLTGSVPHGLEDRSIEPLELITKRAEVNSMNVVVGVDGGDNLKSISRTFAVSRKNGKDSVSQSIELVPARGKNTTEIEREIKSAIGDFPVMFDVHRFVRMSDAKRYELIFRLCGQDAGNWTREVLGQRFNAVIAGLDVKPSGDILRGFDQNFSGDVIAGIGAGLQWLKARQSELQKEIRGGHGASGAAISMATTGEGQSLRHVQDIQADIDARKTEERELVERIAESRQIKVAWARLEAEKSELRGELEVEDMAIQKMIADKFDISSLELNLAGQDKLLEDAGILIQSIKEEIKALFDQVDAVNITISDKVNERAIADADHRTLTANLKATESGMCPTCGQKTDEAIVLIRSKVEKSLAILQSIAEEVGNLSAERIIKIDAMGEMERSLARANLKRDEIQHRISNLDFEIKSARERRKNLVQLQDRLAKLESTRFSGTAINIDEAEMMLSGIRIKLTELSKEHADKIRYDAQVETAKTAALKAKQSEDNLTAIKALIGESESIRAEIVRGSLEPLKGEVNTLFAVSGIVGAQFDFQFVDTRGNEVFQIGWRMATPFGDVFVDFDALSTAQQLYTLVALLAPLVNRGNPNLRILMFDNVEVVDEMCREQFMTMLECATHTYLDNLFIASSSPYPVNGGANVIDCCGTNYPKEVKQ